MLGRHFVLLQSLTDVVTVLRRLGMTFATEPAPIEVRTPALSAADARLVLGDELDLFGERLSLI